MLRRSACQRIASAAAGLASLSSLQCSANETPAFNLFPEPESKGGWEKFGSSHEDLKAAGIQPERVAELRDWLLKSDDRDFAAVVVCNGKIVLEVERGNSSRTDSRRVASCSKAICATVLSIASEQSRGGRFKRSMSFDHRAFDFIPQAKPISDPRKANITVAQLLNHTSGICPESTGMKNSVSWDTILGHADEPRTRDLAFAPGTACGYSTHAFHHASLVCENVTGMTYDQFAIESLFRPTGCEHWWFEVLEGSGAVGPHPSHGLGMPARDLARIAYCMLRGGKWKDAQVIPRWFVDQTAKATHNVTTPELRFKIPAQSFSHGWELPAPRQTEGEPKIPSDARFKPGSGGQLIAFVPSLDLVVTRQTGGSGQWDYTGYLSRACALRG